MGAVAIGGSHALVLIRSIRRELAVKALHTAICTLQRGWVWLWETKGAADVRYLVTLQAATPVKVAATKTVIRQTAAQ